MLEREEKTWLCRQVIKVLCGVFTPSAIPQGKIWENHQAIAFLPQLLLNHGLIGFYLQGLDRLGQMDGCPEALMRELEHQRYAQWTAQAKLAALQDQVCEALGRASVDFLVLKGLPLSERLYGNAFLRPTSDVDILLAKNDVQKVIGILQKKEMVLTHHGKKHFHCTLFSVPFKGNVEVHWNLSDSRFDFPAVEILERASQRPKELISGQMLTVMDPVDELIYLAHHAAVHYLLFRFIWLLDVAAFLQRFGTEINWQILEERCADYKVRKSVAFSLSYAQLIFPEVLTSSLKEQLQSFLRANQPTIFARTVMGVLADPGTPFFARCNTSAFCRKALAFSLIEGSFRKLSAVGRKALG